MHLVQYIIMIQLQNLSSFEKIQISFKTGAVNTDFYRDNDLTLGAVINVWGRKLLICDADEFTREYYRTKFGIGK